MQIYNPADEAHGLLMAQVWGQAKASGDLEAMVADQSKSLPRFLKMLEPPTVTVFWTDEHGIGVLGWFEPIFGFAFFSLWVRPDRREHRQETLETVRQVYELGFKVFPAVLGITKQERLLKSHQRLGYTVVGEMPGLFDGDNAWLVMLTKENFEAHRRS